LYTYTGGDNVLKLLFKSKKESLLSAGMFLEKEKIHIEFVSLTYIGLPGIGIRPRILLFVGC
jgi:hypothetical protein